MDSRVEPKLMVCFLFHVECHRASSINGMNRENHQFFDSAWSVGKVLDVVASSGSVENFNNKPNGPYVR